MTKLTDKVALVIGGGKGIGLATARRYVEEGARVTITGRRADEIAATAASIGARGLACDASDTADLERGLAAFRAEWGRLDILVVSAGVSEHMPLEAFETDHFDRIIDLNVRSLAVATRAATAMMEPGGSVVLIGSVAGTKGFAGYSVYGASKAAVGALARAWAIELAPRGIRVNVVAPGPIDTDMMAAVADDVRAAITGMVPMARFGRPEEVAAAALFLGSDDASYVTGTQLFVDGGMAGA